MKKDYLPIIGSYVRRKFFGSNQQKKSNYLRILTFSTTLIVVGLLVYLAVDKWDEIRSFSWQINIFNLFLVSFFHTLSVAFSFVVWHLIISRLGDFKIIRLNIRYFYTSYLSNRLPTSIPFFSARLFLYRNEGVSTAAVVNGMFFEQVLLVISGIIVFLIFLPFYTEVSKVVIEPLAIIIGLIIITVILLRPQIIVDISNIILKKLHKNILERIPSRGDIVLWTAIYMIPWLCAGFSFFFVIRAFTDIRTIDYLNSLEISTLATLVSFLNIIFPGGIAVKELAFTGLVAPWMSLPVALILAFIYRLVHTFDEIIWAVIASMISEG